MIFNYGLLSITSIKLRTFLSTALTASNSGKMIPARARGVDIRNDRVRFRQNKYRYSPLNLPIGVILIPLAVAP